MLKFIHLFFIGVWLGLYLVETVIEIVGHKTKNHILVAKMHYYVDIFIEIPVFMTVLVTGLLLFDTNKFSGLYAIKIICGLIAVSANIVCFAFVAIRNQAARSNDLERVRKISPYVWIWWAALPIALVPLAIGMHFKGLL